MAIGSAGAECRVSLYNVLPREISRTALKQPPVSMLGHKGFLSDPARAPPIRDHFVATITYGG